MVRRVRLGLLSSSPSGQQRELSLAPEKEALHSKRRALQGQHVTEQAGARVRILPVDRWTAVALPASTASSPS